MTELILRVKWYWQNGADSIKHLFQFLDTQNFLNFHNV